MVLKLQELRRYVIDNRVEIKFSDPDSSHQFLLNNKGQIKILSEDKDSRLEDIFASVQTFEVINEDKTQQMSRAALAEAVGEAFKRRGFAAWKDEEE